MSQSKGSDNTVGQACHQLIVGGAPDETAVLRRVVFGSWRCRNAIFNAVTSLALLVGALDSYTDRARL